MVVTSGPASLLLGWLLLPLNWVNCRNSGPFSICCPHCYQSTFQSKNWLGLSPARHSVAVQCLQGKVQTGMVALQSSLCLDPCLPPQPHLLRCLRVFCSSPQENLSSLDRLPFSPSNQPSSYFAISFVRNARPFLTTWKISSPLGFSSEPASVWNLPWMPRLGLMCSRSPMSCLNGALIICCLFSCLPWAGSSLRTGLGYLWLTHCLTHSRYSVNSCLVRERLLSLFLKGILTYCLFPNHPYFFSFLATFHPYHVTEIALGKDKDIWPI